MRSATIQTLTLIYIASAAAVPVWERAVQDVTPYNTAISSLKSSLVDFDTVINAWTASSDVSQDFTTKASAVVSAIDTGNTNIKNSDPLSLTDAAGLSDPLKDLTNTANNTLNDLVGKHDIIVNAGKGSVALSALTNIKSSMKPFISTVVSKVPDSLKSSVQSTGDKVIAALNRAIVAFGGTADKSRQ